MSDLSVKTCKPCEGGVKPLSKDEAAAFLKDVKNWTISDDNKILSKIFNFKNFYHTMSFVNAIAWIANHENHHPDLEVGYNYCNVHFRTHAIDGLSENDFICAAKIDNL